MPSNLLRASTIARLRARIVVHQHQPSSCTRSGLEVASGRIGCGLLSFARSSADFYNEDRGKELSFGEPDVVCERVSASRFPECNETIRVRPRPGRGGGELGMKTWRLNVGWP